MELSTGQHKYSEYFRSLAFQGNDILELLKEDESEGTVVITNALNRNEFEISVFDAESSYIAKKENGVLRFVDDDDWEYYIKGSMMTSYKFNLFTRMGEKLFQITCNDDLDIYITNNETNIDVLIDEDTDVLYIVDYSRADDDQQIACIYADIVGKGKKFGACQIDCLTEIDGNQWELCLLIGMCTFLIYNKKLKSDEAATAAMSWFALNN